MKNQTFLKWLFPALIAVSTMGCSTLPLQTDYNPATDARIRVFSMPNHTWLYPGKTCATGEDADRIPAHTGGTKFVVPFVTPNRTVGIPKTANMSEERYNEFIVPAGTPLTIESAWYTTGQLGAEKHPRWATSRICRSRMQTFIPVAGQDYDTTLIVGKYSVERQEMDCEIQVRRLVPVAGGHVEPQIMETDWTYRCRKNK